MFDTFLSILYWFARPSIAAWAGAVATVVAVFLAEPRRHLRRPIKFLGRIPRIILVWLIIAWILSQLAGRGTGGAGKGGGQGDTFGSWVHANTNYGGSGVTVRIRFVPREDQKELARDFICLIRLESAEGDAQEQKIVADNLAGFQQQVHRAFKELSERPGKVIVERRPSPGEGVLRLIHSQVEKLWPSLIYEEVEPSALYPHRPDRRPWRRCASLDGERSSAQQLRLADHSEYQ